MSANHYRPLPSGSDKIDVGPFLVAGYVLAGGRSRRMGFDKSEILIDGRSALVRQLDLVREFIDAPSIENPFIVGQSAEVSAGSNEVLVDRGGRQGPLDGIITALHHASSLKAKTRGNRSPTTLALILAVDLWNVTSSEIRQLFAVFREPNSGLVTDVAYLRSAGVSRDQPLCAVWRVPESLGVLEKEFANGERSVVRAWLELRRSAVEVPELVLANINSPEDLERWKAE